MICIGKTKSLLLQQVLSRKSLSPMFEFHREEDVGDSMFFKDSLEWSVGQPQFYLIKMESPKLETTTTSQRV